LPEVLKCVKESLKITRNIAIKLHHNSEEVKRFLEEIG